MRLAMRAVLVLTGAMCRPPLPAAGPEAACADLNGDAAVDMSDAVYLLNHLFLGGQPPVCSLTQIEEEPPSCGSFSRKATEACKHQAFAEYWRARAMCDIAADLAAADCRQAARNRLSSALVECQEQLELRLDACRVLGAPPFDLAIDQRDFVRGVDNPYFPLTPGATVIYESRTGEGTRRREESVAFGTKRILGVECVVVRIAETLNGELMEEGEEWFAQDSGGNVWNFGEWSFDFEDSSTPDWGQQWQAGIDGARPGIVMKGNPRPGDLYFQALAIGVSEDLGQVLSTSEPVSLAAPSIGPFQDCIQVEEFSMLEDEVEHKFFASGFGMVREVNLESGQSMELVERRFSLER